uniref:Ankyrin repeat protein n=1 Tax=Mimivirus LCMiAC01 TaxID=2506608 RepID=A0A481Z097_9VIRU|nr:MAG: ankyrin repeat protein [Mimivirus LCMiAC01]
MSKYIPRKASYPMVHEKIHMPDKSADENYIEKLFTIIQTGDYDKIAKFISESNITLNVANKDGDTAIHIILNNINDDDVDEDIILNMVKYLAEHGAPIDEFNKDNQTPLHLASKHQLLSVAEYLLKKKADPNAIDNQSNTPLHYVSHGNVIKCKVPKKVKALIPDPVKKLDSIVIRKKELKNISANIIDVLYHQYFRKFISHIKKSVGNMEEMYPDKFEKIKNDLMTSITTTIADKTISDTSKRSKIKNIISDTINSINNEMNEQLKTSSKNIDVKPNSKDGWGPVPGQYETHILPQKVENMVKDMVGNHDNAKRNIVDIKLNNTINKIRKLSDGLGANIGNIVNKLYSIVQLNHHARQNVDGLETNIPINNLRDFMHHEDQHIFNYAEINLFDEVNREIVYTTPPNFDVKVVRGTQQQQKDWKTRGIKPIRAFVLSNDRDIGGPNANINNIIVGDNPQPPPGPVSQEPNPFNNFPVAPFDTGIYLFVSKLEYTIKQIKKHVKIIDSNQEALVDHFDKRYYYEIYHRIISEMVHAIINIFQNMTLASFEFSKIGRKLKGLHDTFGRIYEDHKNDDYAYALEYAKNYTDDIRKLVGNIDETFNNMYSELVKLHSMLNEVIKVLNYNSAILYIKNYFINDDNTLKRVTDLSNHYYEMYDRLVNDLPPLLPTLDAYNQKHSAGFGDLHDDMTILKKELYELYIPRIHQRNYQRYYTRVNYNVNLNLRRIALSFRVDQTTNDMLGGGGEIQQPDLATGFLKVVNTPNNRHFTPRTGYLIINRQGPRNIYAPVINILGNSYMKRDRDNNLNVAVAPQFRWDYFTETAAGLPDVPYNGIGIPRKLRDAVIRDNNNPARKYIRNVGHIGFHRPNYTRSPDQDLLNRKNPTWLSVGSYLDDHLNILKNYIIRHIIQKYHDSINAQPRVQLEAHIITLMGNLQNMIENEYKLKGGPHMQGIIYTIIAKITDELLTNFIKYCVQSTGVKFTKNILYELNVSPEYHQLLPPRDDVNIFAVDTGFGLNFNKLFDNIISNFNTRNVYAQGINEDSVFNQLKYSTVVMKKEDKISDQHLIYNIDYDKTNDVIRMCHKINPDIVKILINGGTDVDRGDIVHSSAIMYAIELLYPDLVQAFTLNGATVHKPSIKNSSGDTPLDHELNLYRRHLDYVYKNNPNILKNIYMPLYKEVEKILQSKQEYGNNVIKYLENVFPMVIIMFNNVLHQNMITYTNNWKYDKFKNLAKVIYNYGILSDSDINSKMIPLLNASLIEGTQHNSNLDVLTNAHDDKFSKSSKIAKLKKNRDDLISQKSSIIQEHRDLVQKDQAGQLNDIEREYMRKLNDMIQDIDNNKLADIRRKINDAEGKNNYIDQNINDRTDDVIQLFRQRVHTFIQNGDDRFGLDIRVPKVYDNIFDLAINIRPNRPRNTIPGHEDFGLYNKLWDMYIHSNDGLKNITNIHIIMVMLQSKILDDIKRNDIKNANIIINDLEVMKTLHSDVFAFFINNYFDLPQNYNEMDNVSMKSIIDIIIHPVKYVICSSLYSAVIKATMAFVKTLNPKDIDFPTPERLNMYRTDGEYNEYINAIIDNVVTQTYQVNQVNEDKSNLKEYIIDKMPTIIVKMLLGIYSGDYDEDKQTTSMDEIFEQISDILISVDVIPIAKDSSLIQNLTEYVYPYYSDILTNIVPALKSMIDKYCGYIMNEARHIEILQILLTKAITE